VAIKMPSADDVAQARRKADEEKHRENLTRLQAAIEGGQGDALAWYQLGISYVHLERRMEAIQAFRKALEMDPRFIHAWVNLATVHFNLGEYDKAVEYNRRALDIAHGFVPARVNLGLSLNALGRYNESIDELSRVLHLEPKMPMALAGLYEAHLALKHADEAKRFRALAEAEGVRFKE